MNDTALQMADELDRLCDPYDSAIASELRRLHAENEALRTERDKALSENQRWIGLASAWAQEVKTEQRLSFRHQLKEAQTLNAELVEALQLALSSYGVMMMGNPPQEAWDVWKVEEKARAALAKVGASK